MKQTEVKKSEIKLVGLSVRTSNAREFNPDTAKIGSTLERYRAEDIASQISNRVNPGVMYCVYTDYVIDEHADYTYFVGEEVDSFENTPMGYETLTIPDSSYQKFECGPGQMPDICIEAWQKIWGFSDEELQGKRSYQADFEVYDYSRQLGDSQDDQKTQDPSNMRFDIFVGISESW